MPETRADQPLIEVAELAELLRSADTELRPVVLDVRWSLGRGRDGNRAEFAAAHIPGAAFLDLESALAGHPREDGVGGRHPLPSLLDATEGLRAAGVTSRRPVVLYDAANSLAAARGWWIMHYFGKHDVRVLNGGYAAWAAAGLPGATGEESVPRGDIVLVPGARPALSAEEIGAYGHGVIIDARAPERYRGEVEPIDPVAGHIPGALNVPTLGLLSPDGSFDLASARVALSQAGVQPDTEVAIYCGSGVQAAHLALTMEATQPGRVGPALYVGSWSDWISDPARPVVT